jgi:glycerol-3-phosphate dehydrogenase (NAD(P)+)
MKQKAVNTQINEKVAVLGDGQMGTVCSIVLGGKGLSVALWSKFPDRLADIAAKRENRSLLPGHRLPDTVTPTQEADETLDGATWIVSAIPCQFLRSVWKEIGGFVAEDASVVSVTKGIENGTLARPSEIIAEFTGKIERVAVLSGPTIANELARGLPATATVASDNTALAKEYQRLFTTDWWRIYTNPDPLGVELAGATKNVIAIAAGIIDGLELGSNTKAALITRGLVEITRLGAAMGAMPETFAGLAGLGDLVTTCISEHGRNRTVGERLARGEKLEKIIADMTSIAEGVATTKSVIALADNYSVDMPITRCVSRILFEGLHPQEGIAELMSRKPKPEFANNPNLEV